MTNTLCPATLAKVGFLAFFLLAASAIVYGRKRENASISVHLRQISEELSHLRNADDKADVEEAVYLLESRERSAKRIREAFSR